MTTERIEFIESQRKRKILLCEGYTYHSDKQTKSGHSWRCTLRGCSGRIVVNSTSYTVIKRTSHCHEPSKEKEVKAKVNEIINKKITTTNDDFEDLIKEVFAQFTNGEIEAIGRYESLRDNFKRKKRKVFIDQIKEYEDIPECLKVTNNNEKFLFYDSGINNPDRILIYSTYANLNILSDCETWLSDGTFKSVPKEYYQLYVIHAMFFKTRIPLVYIYMKSKHESVYREIFDFLKNTVKKEPKVLITDFEIGPASAFSSIFKHAHVFGCYFHFSQIIWRWCQKLNLSKLYKSSEFFRLNIRKLMALAYVKADKVYVYFSILKKQVSKHAEYTFLEDLFDSFENAYLNESTSCITKSIAFWSVYERVLLSLPTTTNSLEAWHKNLNIKNIVAKPNFYNAITTLKNEESRILIKLSNITNGKVGSENQDTKSIYNVVKNFDCYEPLEYLSIVSFSIKIKFEPN